MDNNSTLINSLLPLKGVNTYIKNIFLVLFGTLLLTVSSKIQVPFWPVPMTMQTFVVLIIAMAYGWKLSFLTLVALLTNNTVILFLLIYLGNCSCATFVTSTSKPFFSNRSIPDFDIPSFANTFIFY